MTISSARLLTVFANKDTFAIIDTSMHTTDVTARAKRHRIPLIQASNGLTISYLSQLGSSQAETIGLPPAQMDLNSLKV